MNKLISETNKFDNAIVPASINGASTGRYFDMCNYRLATFVMTLGVLATDKTSVMQVMQAIDADGTDAKVITDATVTVTANENATVAKLAIVTAAGGVHIAGQTVTINGYVFTAAAADNPLTREYAVGASGADSAAALLAKINSSDEDITVPYVIGTASIETTNSVITLKAIETGELTISASASDATTIVSTVEALAFIDVGVSALDVNNDFSHIALNVTNSAATLTGATLLRDSARYNPVQKVAGEISVLS